MKRSLVPWAPALLTVATGLSAWGASAGAPATRPSRGTITVTTAPSDAPPLATTALGRAEDTAPLDLQARPFESVAGGIALCPPVGFKSIREVGKDDLVEFVDEKSQWQLLVKRWAYPRAMSLFHYKNERGEIEKGIVEKRIAALAQAYGDPSALSGTEAGPGADKQLTDSLKLLRQDVTNIGNYDVGMVAFRYRRELQRKFVQEAIIQANDQLYYLVSLTVPGRQESIIPLNKDGEEATEDKGERRAVETFRRVIDSIRLLDRRSIKQDQDERLVRTRSLFLSFTARKVIATIVPEQWLRITRDGKDIGYSYVVERPERIGNVDAVTVGVRTRTMDGGMAKPFPREEGESWFHASLDRRHEDWTKLTVYDDGLPKTASHPWKKMTEFASSDKKTRKFAVGEGNGIDRGELDDPKAPRLAFKDEYLLNVQYTGNSGIIGDMEAVNRQLPIFYLPQAFQHLLPRLVPPNEVKTYLVATYGSDAHEVMLRYIDVLAEQSVTLAGRTMRAVPIRDHVGLDGSVTIHYVTSRGEYLGSENKDSKLIIIPSDQKTLTDIWPDAKLEAPGVAGPAPAGAALINPVAPGGGGGSLSRDSEPTRGRITVGPALPGADPDPERVVPRRLSGGGQ